jgi:hypothetical protein
MSSKLVTGGILALIGLVTLKVVMFLVGGTLAILGVFLKLLPLLIIGWIIWRLLKPRPSTASAD